MVYVKWLDFNEVSAEPLSNVVRDTRGDADILRQIQDAQQRYRDEHPVRVLAGGEDLPPVVPRLTSTSLPPASESESRPAPTRILPPRRARPTQFHVEHVVSPAYRDAARAHASRARAFDCL